MKFYFILMTLFHFCTDCIPPLAHIVFVYVFPCHLFNLLDQFHMLRLLLGELRQCIEALAISSQYDVGLCLFMGF